MRLIWDHIVFFFQGCKHPKTTPEGSFPVDFGGEPVTFFLETCTVCGITLIHEA